MAKPCCSKYVGSIGWGLLNWEFYYIIFVKPNVKGKGTFEERFSDGFRFCKITEFLRRSLQGNLRWTHASSNSLRSHQVNGPVKTTIFKPVWISNQSKSILNLHVKAPKVNVKIPANSFPLDTRRRPWHYVPKSWVFYVQENTG